MAGDFEALIKNLAKAAGLSEEMAGDIIGTAVDYVKAQRPDKAEEIDARLQDENIARKAGALIGKLAKQADVMDADLAEDVADAE